VLRVALLSCLLAVAGGSFLYDVAPAKPAAAAVPAHVALTVDLARPAAEVEDRFLSVAIDTAQVVGGEFWAPPGSGEGWLQTHSVRRYDFERPRLRNLARALGPAYLRVGGTAADWTVYRMDDGAGAGAPAVPDGARFALTRQRWDEVNAFARDLDFRIMFTLNAGRSARDADGGWDPNSARELIGYSQRRGYPVDVWELGNEANAFPLSQRSWITADRYADDLRRARGLLDGLHAPARLAGLASAFWPVMGEWRSFTEEVLRAAGGTLDIVTWHYYPQQSRRCPIATRRAQPGSLPSAEALGDVDRWAERVESAARVHAPRAAVWLGETGSAQCGGEPGFSNSYADALWWLDEMGRVARRGQQVVVRQTLSGSDYGLIDDETLQPNPSYWASWLWRNLMGRRALAVAAAPAEPGLRAYAHCLRGEAGAPADTGVALLAINVDAQRPITVELPPGAGAPSRVLRLDADALASRELRLGGVVLRADPDGRPPALPPFGDVAGEAPARAGSLVVPPLSAAFVIFPSAGAAACAQPS
jgi:heparanase 1